MLTLEKARLLPKIVHHEHFDCSISPQHILTVANREDLDVPTQFKSAWAAAAGDSAKQVVSVDYQSWLNEHARKSLTNYLAILWSQVLPTLQTQDDIYETARQRIEDAVADGIIFLKLRFAPQLHQRKGLTLQQVIDPLQQAAAEAPFPVRLVICSLRHEDGEMARQLADAVIANQLVSSFDLAGDETKFPGVPAWWAEHAARVNEAGKQVTCHIGETNAITADDHCALDAIGCTELGHGIKGDPWDKLCTICITSNLVTQVVSSLEEHPVDRLYRGGKQVNIDLDGTLLTGTTTSHEYVLLSQAFNWQTDDFLRCNLIGLKHVPLPQADRQKLEELLYAGYKSPNLLEMH